jgi:hypothetical protein
MQNNLQTLNLICKILQGLYFAYFAYICTRPGRPAQFADGRTVTQAGPGPETVQDSDDRELPTRWAGLCTCVTVLG